MDYPRYFWKEGLKRTIVSKFDSAVVGGIPHMDYVKTLGLHSNYIYYGCAVVDNDYWAGWAERVQETPQFWRQKYGLPERFFMTSCRLVPKKNVAGLLKAYSHYRKQYSDNPWPLVIAGDGPLRSELVHLAENLGIDELIHFVGYKSANDLGPIYGLASVFILASAFSEQWGLVVNEAMAARKPVLVSRICGCASDLVIDGITGFTFNPDNVEEIATLLLKMSRGDYDLQKMGHEAQKKIEQYSPELFAQHAIEAAELAVARAEKRRFQSFDWFYLKTLAKLI
jgi:glycosyltransferase involved in cell wall biosynthesis